MANEGESDGPSPYPIGRGRGRRPLNNQQNQQDTRPGHSTATSTIATGVAAAAAADSTQSLNSSFHGTGDTSPNVELSARHSPIIDRRFLNNNHIEPLKPETKESLLRLHGFSASGNEGIIVNDASLDRSQHSSSSFTSLTSASLTSNLSSPQLDSRFASLHSHMDEAPPPSGSTEQHTEPVVNGKGTPTPLNVHATEFITSKPFHPSPDVYSVTNSTHEVTQTSQFRTSNTETYQSGYAASSAQHQRSQFGNLPPIEFVLELPPYLLDVSDDGAINVLKVALVRLIEAPGNLNEIVGGMKDVLDALIERPETLAEMVNVIFELVVNRQPFAYTAARLCKYLSSLSPHRAENTSNWSFQKVLVKRCHQLFNQRQNMDRIRIKGYALFLAELYEVCTLDNGEKNNVLAKALIGILKELIQPNQFQSDSDLLKTVIKVLKLAGSSLDDRDQKAGTTEMDEIFSSFDLAMQNCTDGTVCDMARKLLEFRQTDWGRQVTDSYEPVVESPVTFQQYEAEPVFFDAQGQPISRFEAEGYTYDMDMSGYEIPAEWSVADQTSRAEQSPSPTSDDEQYDESYLSDYNAFLQNLG